jgi:hypothetical protein
MYTGLKIQNNFTGEYQNMILSENHELVKLKKIIDWGKIDRIYKKCYKANVGNSTKETNIVIGLILLKHFYNKCKIRGNPATHSVLFLPPVPEINCHHSGK